MSVVISQISGFEPGRQRGTGVVLKCALEEGLHKTLRMNTGEVYHLSIEQHAKNSQDICRQGKRIGHLPTNPRCSHKILIFVFFLLRFS